MCLVPVYKGSGWGFNLRKYHIFPTIFSKLFYIMTSIVPIHSVYIISLSMKLDIDIISSSVRRTLKIYTYFLRCFTIADIL